MSVASNAFSWFSSEILSLLQLLFFLSLGYAVTRTWIWSQKKCALKAIPKKIEDVDQVVETLETSESDACLPKTKAHERKRNKKSKVRAEKLPEELDSVACVVPASEEEQPQELPAEETEELFPEVKTTPEAAQDDAPQDVAQEVSQDKEATLEDAQEADRVREKVAKMMAKKQERKARKAAQEKAVLEEKLQEEENVYTAVAGADQPAIATYVEVMSDAEALSDDMAQTTSTPSMVSAPLELAVEDTPIERVSAVVPEEPEEEAPSMRKSKDLSSSETLDNMETDAQSESDSVCVRSSTPEGVSTPEPCMSPREVSSEQMMWCDMLQMEGMPQIEGWVPIMVPAECAPLGAPGPFDGIWENQQDERIVIDHEDVSFDNGMLWVMEMQSITSLSVKVGDEEFSAELDPVTQHLHWSDGDVWKCVGQTDAQKKWIVEREADGLPPVLFDGMQFLQPMVMPTQFPVAQNQLVPEDAKSWETCWDWSKKGYCPRGVNCEWYHPTEAGNQFQQCVPCESFASYMGAPFTEGPIY